MKLTWTAAAVTLAGTLTASFLFSGQPGRGQETAKTPVVPQRSTATPVPDPINIPPAGAIYTPVTVGGNTYYTVGGAPYRIGGGDPQMDKLVTRERLAQSEAANLIRKYGATENEDDKAKVKSDLTAVLGKQFDAQQERRELELARLEAQVKKLRNLMKKRTEGRQTIVEKRLDQLLREAEGLGWSAPPGLHYSNSYPDVLPTPVPTAGPKFPSPSP